MKRTKRSRPDSEDLGAVTPSDTSGTGAVLCVSLEKTTSIVGNGDAVLSGGEMPVNPPKKRGRPPKQKSSQDDKELLEGEKALLPDGCEVPTEVTPVLLIKNVFNAQGECLAEEAKGQVLDGNSLQLVASEETALKAKVTPRRGRPSLVKKREEDIETSSSSKSEEKPKDASQKEVRRGRPPKYKTRKEAVDSLEKDVNNVTPLKNKSSSSSSKKMDSEDESKLEKVQPLGNSQPLPAKRGWPLKRAHSSPDRRDESDEVSNRKNTEVDSETSSPVKKRGRGRPPKKKLTEETNNPAQKKDKKPPMKKLTPQWDSTTPEDIKSSDVKRKVGRPRKITENAESSNDTLASDPEHKPNIIETPLLDSASARRSRQLKAKKIFEDYEEYTPGKPKQRVVPLNTTPYIKKSKKVASQDSPEKPVCNQVIVSVKNKGHSNDDDKCKINESKLEKSKIPSSKSGGTSEKDFSKASKETEVFSIDSSTSSEDHKPPSAAQVIIIKSKPKVESSHADNPVIGGKEANTKSCEKPKPISKGAVENVAKKQTKVLPSQNRLPRQQRSTRTPAKKQQVTSFKTDMCMAPEIKLDLPVSGLLDSVNMSTQPEIRTLYMFQNTSTNGWLKIICKRISGVQFYQCPLCPYKDPVPRKVADHLHEDHPSLVSIAEGKCTRIFATFLFMFCRHCDFIAYEKLALWYHFEQYHGLTDMINAKPIDPASINMTQFAPMGDHALKTAKIVLRCNECDFLSLSKRQAMMHVLKEHSDVRRCLGNGFVIISQLDAMSPPGDEALPSDVANLPEELKSMVMKDCFICTECMFVTYKRALMEIHCVNNHAKRLLLLVCSVCGDQFDTTYKMSSHIATAHSESKRQFCTVTLVDADGREDTRLRELAKQRKVEASEAAALQEPTETPSADQSEAKPVTTAQQSQQSFTDANIPKSTQATHHVSAANTLHHARPAKTRPVAVVSGSSCGQTTSVRKVWPGQSVVKHQPQQHRSLQAKWPTDQKMSLKTVTTTTCAPGRSPNQKVTQLQVDSGQQHLQVTTDSVAKPCDSEKQLTYIQMPDGTHHQVELTEDADGQLQYVLTENRESGVEVAVDSTQQMSYVKLPDGSIQPLSSGAESGQSAESAEEIRYLQLPDGSLQQLPAETGDEVHYVQMADGSLQLQISSVTESGQSAETMNEVHYMKFPDGSIQQITEGGQVAENNKNVRYVALEDGSTQHMIESGLVESSEQVHYGKLPDGSIQQVTEGEQAAVHLPHNVQKAMESDQEMHYIKLPDGRFQQVTKGGQEVCYVKMPDGSIQQVAESVQSVENGESCKSSESVSSFAPLNEGTAEGKTVSEQIEDTEQTTYVQYIIQMDNNEQSDMASEPQVAPCVGGDDNNRSPKFTSVQTSGGGSNHVAMDDQSGGSTVAESRSEGTKMVSLLSQDVLANVQAQQTTVAAAATPSESTTQPMVMQAYNVNGETIILCCDPDMVISDQQAAQVMPVQPGEAEHATNNGQRLVYAENESTVGNFEDAFQTFVNSNSTQQQ